jgi:8-oxo-dGTP pyrophosphatase MutT (NUDIX family)
LECAKRELQEETGLSGIPKLAGIFHYRIFNQEGTELLDDLLLFLCRFENPTGDLISSHEGKYEWIDVENVKAYISKPFQSKEWFLNEIRAITHYTGHPKFTEKVYRDSYNF